MTDYAFLDPGDLAPFATIDQAKAEAMITDASATAARVAPCITAVDFAEESALRAILRAAVLRWNEAGTGAVQSQTAGPYGQTIDNRQPRKGMFWPSEIEQLQALCKGEETGAFSIDTAPCSSVHSPICALYFGALYCSCGADLTGYVYPLYEDVEP